MTFEWSLQALETLAVSIRKHAAQQQQSGPIKMWYASTHVQEQAAAAGGFLIELLQMRVLQFSRLSHQPAAFSEAGKGMLSEL